MTAHLMPKSILLNAPCAKIANDCAHSLTDVAVHELTVFRNGKTCQPIRQIVAEFGYLALAVVGTVEFLARAVSAVVLLPVMGIVFFIGCLPCCGKLQGLSGRGAKFLAASTLLTGVAAYHAIVNLKGNLFKAPILNTSTFRQTMVFSKTPKVDQDLK
jgi:hypothetical protein